MNEADPSPINLDELRMLPDWLREEAPAPSKQYASHDYPLGDAPDRRGGRPGNFGGRNDRRDNRGGGSPDRRREGGRSSSPRRGDERDPRNDRRPPQDAPHSEPTMPAPVRVEFLPDDRCLASINKQIRSTHLAYPLFGLARMFLQEPERHFVQFAVAPDAPAGTQLYQLGDDGPITLDRATLEKLAFDSTKEQFYIEATVQKEPLKGNFTNVARERLSGILLGPTNYHAYQPALRSLYESRYSRRMSFEDFRRNVEVSTDPVLIERWKEEARTMTTTSTRVSEGETPVVLAAPADVRAHFRLHHLDQLVRAGNRFKVHGSVARKLPESSMMQAIRAEHEQEMRYPAHFVQLLRQGLQNAGLHIFKHRKRVVYVSLARPMPFVAHRTVSPSVSAILETIAQSPLCTRKLLAERVLARGLSHPPAPAQAEEKPFSSEASSPDVHAVAEDVSSEATPLTEAATSSLPAEVEKPTALSSDGVTSSGSADEVSGETPVEAASDASMTVVAETPIEALPTGNPVATAESINEDPVQKAKAALAADLRFLVQSGHIIEFHNGTFDLPLPPKAKEEGAPNPTFGGKANPLNRSGSNDKTRQPRVPEIESQFHPVAAEVEQGFVASGEGVEDAVSTSVDTLVESAPALSEVIDPAPTAPSHSEEDTPAEAPSATLEATPVVPVEAAEPVPVDIIHDKVDDDGRVSGPAFAPMDLPVVGDTEESADIRS